MRIWVLLSLLALAACASGPPMAGGPWRPIAFDKWGMSDNDLPAPLPSAGMRR